MPPLTNEELQEGSELFAGAIQDPFFTLDAYGQARVRLWFSFLVRHFPLSCFRTESYLALGNPDLPTTDPLERLLRSVLTDDGWRGWDWDFGAGPDALHEITYNRAARLKELSRERGSFFDSCLTYEEDNGGPYIQTEYNLYGITEPDPIVEWDDEGPIGVHTVYEEIGRNLVALIEHRDAQEQGSAEAQQAQEDIDAFLRRISARRGRGRPPEAVPTDILAALIEDATELLRVVWAATLPVTPSRETRGFLAQQGIEDAAAQDTTALRLALPLFSLPELTAISEHVGQDWITPRRMSILIVARRLDLDGAHVARRITGAAEEERFRNHAWRFDI